MNRREFVGTAAAAAGALVLGEARGETAAGPTRASDTVRLGSTGITVSLLGVGTGTVGSGHQSNQTRLGQEQFTAVIRHAYDSGIRFYDTADQYGSHSYLREALKGLPRERYVIQTKTNTRSPEGIREVVDRFRKELGVEYIDVLLLHCLMEPDWTTRYRPAMDTLEQARLKGAVRAHGVSCHTFGALQAAAEEPWCQIDLARFNPWGRIMDTPPGEPDERAPQAVKPVLQKMRRAGKGVVGMKILAEGRVMRGDDRLARARESLKHALSSGVLHSMVIGFESRQQVTELVHEMQVALAELREDRMAAR